MESLTPRAIEVLRLIAKGYTNGQIAGVEPQGAGYTNSQAIVRRKLELRSRVELVRYAMAHGLSKPL